MGLSAFDKICAILAEVIGTGLLVFIGCMSVCSFDAAGNPLLNIALAFGLAIMIGAQSVGHISGGHFNPAVSVAAMIYRVIDIPMGAAYIVAQLVGGTLAYGVLKIVMTDKMQSGPDGVCVTKVNNDLTMAEGFLVEFLATGILIWVICGFWDPRNAKKTDSTPLKAGLTVAILVMVAGPFTGGSLNPARSFGPALWTGDWEDHWVYWVAPTLGGAVFSLLYKSVFWRSPSDLDD